MEDVKVEDDDDDDLFKSARGLEPEPAKVRMTYIYSEARLLGHCRCIMWQLATDKNEYFVCNYPSDEAILLYE